MGVAVLSGTLASLESNAPSIPPQKWEYHTSGTTTPVQGSDPSLPSRFLACVNREESARKLRKFFGSTNLGQTVEVSADQNVYAVKQSDVILLW